MIKSPNYTQIPNVYFDEIMKNLNGSENLVFLAIMRKTFGWQKKKDRISYSQIMELTGIARSTTANALKELEEKGYISAERKGQIISYYVNVDEETSPKIGLETKNNQSENRTGTSPKIGPVLEETSPKIGHTKESNINKKEIYIEIENAYVESFKKALPNGEPIIDYQKARSRLKQLLLKMSEQKIIQAIRSAETDDWIINGGFSLMVILSDYQLNKLLNGRQSSSKPLSGFEKSSAPAAIELKNCKKCGYELKDRFCPKCGTNYDIRGEELCL